MRKSMEKKRNPVLLNTLLASLPMFRYSRPIRTPIHKCDITLRWVNTWTHSYKCSNMHGMMFTITWIWMKWSILLKYFTCCKTGMNSYHVSAYSDKGPFEKNAELCEGTGSKGVFFNVSWILWKRKRTCVRQKGAMGRLTLFFAPVSTVPSRIIGTPWED